MGRTPTPEQIAKLKRLSILDPEETDTLVAEMVRITQRCNTPAELPEDDERFSVIITSMLSDDVQEVLIGWLERGKRH